MKKATTKPKASTPPPTAKMERRVVAENLNELPSLLSMEAEGFTVAQHWPRLFTLYARGKEWRAELCFDLHEVERALVRNRPLDDETAPPLEASFFNVLRVQEALKMKRWPEGFDDIAGSVGFSMARAIGPSLLRLWCANNEPEAKQAADELCAVFNRAVSGMVRMKFPKRARGSGDQRPKPLLAIWIARGLCETLRRLPTKAEVRSELGVVGVTFSKRTKDAEGRWRELFYCAGLARLPD
jgi:hypothetical protein